MQYAYKKDGKGERHGDVAERTLAAQARKHGVQPTGQPLPVGLFTGSTPNAPSVIADGDSTRAINDASVPSSNYIHGRGGPLNGIYQNIPGPQQQRPTQPPQPLPNPPSGLPARPPPSQAGYGGPQGFLPPGFNSPQPPGFTPQIAPPGLPLGLPPGFQPQPFIRNR